VLAARSQRAFEALVALQNAGRIEKTYLALVRGRPTDLPASIDLPLGPAGEGAKAARPDPKGRPASTSLEPRDRIGQWLLVAATIHRGVRHQIRAHLAHAGLPIAGDALYGGPRASGLERLFLHASEVSLPHPIGGDPVEFHSPLPADLEALVRPAAR
jgi:23S rRNA pseudouridine1911/1915/1917 synthase